MTGAHEGLLVQARGLHTHFGGRAPWFEQLLGRSPDTVRAVDGVDLEIRPGEVLGLVGESGSGKTTLGKTILRLAPATSGKVFFEEQDIVSLKRDELKRFRRQAQMIFQDPHSSLSPRLRVSQLLTEPYTIHSVPEEERYSVPELLEMVELSSELGSKYAHELSGGQARRVGIARALALRPKLLVADEPTAGLDVSAIGKVVNLMDDLRKQFGLTYLIITHDISVVEYIADRLAVMYLGKLFEVGPTERVLDEPAHPYTRALLSAVSEPDPRQRRNDQWRLPPGEIPSPKNPPQACRFHTRCAFADERSRTEEPQLEKVGPGHFVACHHWRKIMEEHS
jgi:oligopeptide transport system ATP-binding protein